MILFFPTGMVFIVHEPPPEVSETFAALGSLPEVMPAPCTVTVALVIVAGEIYRPFSCAPTVSEPYSVALFGTVRSLSKRFVQLASNSIVAERIKLAAYRPVIFIMTPPA